MGGTSFIPQSDTRGCCQDRSPSLWAVWAPGKGTGGPSETAALAQGGTGLLGDLQAASSILSQAKDIFEMHL